MVVDAVAKTRPVPELLLPQSIILHRLVLLRVSLRSRTDIVLLIVTSFVVRSIFYIRRDRRDERGVVTVNVVSVALA